MRAFSLAALLAFLIDQASKIWVLYGLSMTVGDRWEIFPPFLVFQFGWNPGINFGLFGFEGLVLCIGLVLVETFANLGGDLVGRQVFGDQFSGTGVEVCRRCDAVDRSAHKFGSDDDS